MTKEKNCSSFTDIRILCCLLYSVYIISFNYIEQNEIQLYNSTEEWHLTKRNFFLYINLNSSSWRSIATIYKNDVISSHIQYIIKVEKLNAIFHEKFTRRCTKYGLICLLGGRFSGGWIKCFWAWQFLYTVHSYFRLMNLPIDCRK